MAHRVIVPGTLPKAGDTASNTIVLKSPCHHGTEIQAGGETAGKEVSKYMSDGDGGYYRRLKQDTRIEYEDNICVWKFRKGLR